jgi:hypothetical protein
MIFSAVVHWSSSGPMSCTRRCTGSSDTFTTRTHSPVFSVLAAGKPSNSVWVSPAPSVDWMARRKLRLSL